MGFGVVHVIVVLGIVAFWVAVFVMIARFLKRGR